MINRAYDVYREEANNHKILLAIMVLSLALSLWGSRWGAANFWHPDEVTNRALFMVYDRTLNPHYFTYGGLHYYVVIVGAIIPAKIYQLIFDPKPPSIDRVEGTNWEERHKGRIVQISRIISAFMSALIAGFVFMIGSILFDRRIGNLAALMLSVSMYHVAIAHFATVDTPANFWYWLSCLFALLVWKRGDWLWYWAAAVTAGLAIGTKTDRLVVLVPLVMSHFLRGQDRQNRRILLSLVLIPTCFALVNPTLVFSPFEFLDGYTRDMFFNSLRTTPGTDPPHIQILSYTRSGMGMPLFLTVLAGLIYAACRLSRGKNVAEITWLLATIVPCYLIFAHKPTPILIPPWYASFFAPCLVIFGAYGFLGVSNCLSRQYLFVLNTLIVAVVVCSLLYTIALNLQFSNDSRYQAIAWIERHVPPNSAIQVPPWVPQSWYRRYQIMSFHSNKEDLPLRWRENLLKDTTYKLIRELVFDLENWTGRHFGLKVRTEPYRSWYDEAALNYERSLSPLSGTIHAAKPDYVVVLEHQQEAAAFKQLNSGYRLVARFHFTFNFGFRPSFQFVNPPICVFQREELIG